MNTVSAKKDLRSLRIYINNLLHLEILMDNHDGLQSWLEGSGRYNYFIEFYRRNSKSILCEYDDRNIWENILKEIEKNL